MEFSILIICLIVLSGFIKGFSGFGLSLLLISVLLDIGFKASELLPILVPLFVILDLILFFENRKYLKIDFKENFTMHSTTLLSLFLGILLGTYLLTITSASWLKLSFAILILVMLFLLVEKVNLYQMKIPSEKENGFFGFFSGLLTGLFTMNAVPATIYLMYHQYPKEKYMANLVNFLLVSDLILVAVYLSKNLFTISGLIISFKLVFLVLIGFFIGIFLRKYVSTKTFKILVIFFLAANSLKIIFEFFFK